jgi:inosose dehydratase
MNAPINNATTARRKFLTTTAAATAGIAMFDIPALLGADDPFLGLPIGIQSYSLRGFGLHDAIRHIQAMGLHYVEFYQKHVPQNIAGENLKALTQLLTTADINMVAHGVWGFNSNHEKNKSIFDFAKRIGVKCITANPTADAFESLDKLVAQYNIRIAIHNHGPGAIYDSIDSVAAAIKDHHPLIGSCVDTGHFIRSKQDPVKAVYQLKGRVFALHIKDEAKQEKQSHNVIIGKGHLDVVGMFTALKKTRFPADGSISLEYEANPENPIAEIKQCIEVAKTAIAKVHKS